MSTLAIRPLGGVGAEITGVDIRRLSNAEFDALHAAFIEHGLIFLRDQEISEEDHIAFARRFGDININRFFAAHPDYPEIALVAKEPGQKDNIGGGWHTDHSYDLEPAMGSILVAREVPPRGGDTLFASMYAAFDALSEGFKDMLRGLRAVHSARHIFGSNGGYAGLTDAAGDRIQNAEAADTLPDPVHPVVIRHPLSGKEALYVNPAFTLHFEGWTMAESQPLLAQLYAHCARPEFTTRFAWAPGSIAFWDNRATWHYALNDYHGHRRLMHRITLEGGPLGR